MSMRFGGLLTLARGIRFPVLVPLLVFSILFSQNASYGASEDADTSRNTLSRAAIMLGFDNPDIISKERLDKASSEKTLMSDTTVAFSRQYVDGRTAWHFVFDEINWIVAGDPIPETREPQRVEIWVDSSSEKLLLLRSSQYPIGYGPDPRPPWTEVFRPLTFLHETFTGFPDREPLISLAEALNRCKGSPFSAEVWHAAYLMWFQNGSEPTPAWVFQFAGLPGDPGRGDEPMGNQRVVVDAMTGSVLLKTWYSLNPGTEPEPKE